MGYLRMWGGWGCCCRQQPRHSRLSGWTLTRVSVQHGTPPLLIAAGCGNIQIIEVLMRKGAEIQANDKVRGDGRHGNNQEDLVQVSSGF